VVKARVPKGFSEQNLHDALKKVIADEKGEEDKPVT
jgi:hypothetical protein